MLRSLVVKLVGEFLVIASGGLFFVDPTGLYESRSIQPMRGLVGGHIKVGLVD